MGKDKGKKTKEAKPQEEKKSATSLVAVSEQAYAAEVLEVLGTLGTKQGGFQVRVKVLQGPDEGKVMRRNVLGPVRLRDILMLKQTEIEAMPLKGGRK